MFLFGLLGTLTLSAGASEPGVAVKSFVIIENSTSAGPDFKLIALLYCITIAGAVTYYLRIRAQDDPVSKN